MNTSPADTTGDRVQGCPLPALRARRGRSPRGSFGELLVSWLVVALFLGELLWWPRARARLLARTDRAEASTRRTDPGAPDSTP
ncbi:hypothetical protein ACGFX8_21250 [Streptomyces sp. NPDC048362]|uniref:hypothetical protein n=1 Tax=Streptomyces sp. NPDC048362 TaxID=3365539 RepID=UPI00371923A2